MKVRLICFGNSTENLELSIKYHVIGIKKNVAFMPDETIYLIKKDDKEWNVYARGQVLEKTDSYPFNDWNTYYTYSITKLESCKPFSINEMCKEELGPYWGLKFQQPSIIEAEKFIERLNASFKRK